MNPKVYIETTVVSYLTARPSRNLIMLVHQQLTQDWWQDQSAAFDLFVSALVVEEARRGDEELM